MCSLAITSMGQSVKTGIGTIYGYIGQSVTLKCDLEGIYNGYEIIWYRSTADGGYYISHEDTLYQSSIPDDLEERIAITCDRTYDHDSCSLLVLSLRETDSGIYQCGYQTLSQAYILSSGELIVGTLPSADSPICSLRQQTTGGTFAPAADFTIGDEIYLHCGVKDSVVPVSLQWLTMHQGYLSGTAQPVKGISVQNVLHISEEVVGIQYVCVMNIPILSISRNCTITPLPILPTTTTSTSTSTTTTTPVRATLEYVLTPSPSPNQRTTKLVLFTSSAITSEEATLYWQLENSESKTTQRIPSYVFISIAIIIPLIITIGIVVAVLIKRTRNNVTPKPNCEVAYDNERSINPEYEVIQASDHETFELQSVKRSLEHKEKEEEETLLEPEYKKGADTTSIPVYAKVNKKNKISNMHQTYETVSHQDSVKIRPERTSSTESEGLMYADLDIPDTVDSNAFKILSNQNKTLYADIRGFDSAYEKYSPS